MLDLQAKCRTRMHAHNPATIASFLRRGEISRPPSIRRKKTRRTPRLTLRNTGIEQHSCYSRPARLARGGALSRATELRSISQIFGLDPRFGPRGAIPYLTVLHEGALHGLQIAVRHPLRDANFGPSILVRLGPRPISQKSPLDGVIALLAQARNDRET